MSHALRLPACLLFVATASVAFFAAASPTPSLEDRIAARRAVEEVLWRHRIWPADNSQAKPPLASVLSDAEIRARVVDDLRKSQALATFWKRPVTAAMLETEVRRMTSGSKDPALLRELFEALGNDPVLIRETIGRPALADRLMRAWYARDPRRHADVRNEAQSASEALNAATAATARGYVESSWARHPAPGAIALDGAEWDELTQALERRFGSTRDGSADPPRAGEVSPLVEEDDAFRVYVVRAWTAEGIRIGVVSWPKTPFESWWAATAPAVDASLPEAGETAPAAPDGPGPPCADDTWHALGAATPSARYGHVAVWTGSEMLVWGGWTPSGATATGGRYVPATDTWYQMNSIDAPSARTAARAVWTGSEAILWGGQQDPESLTPLGTGARFAPATGRWVAMSSGGAPTARQGHTLVWTGSRVVVWGGSTTGGSTATGALYDPAADGWTATSMSGAPAPRTRHVAVWTGARMIVWSGSEGGSIATGGRFDPVANAWSPMATAGEPSLRSDATAVWTGSVMVAWGGDSGGGWLSTGGRYDPVADTWSPTSMSFAPASRYNHTAVWTGSRMIVWGGETPTGETATGGVYDPAADTWSPTATGGAPERRRSHSAVWTGSEMVVWGGTWLIAPPSFLQYLDSGGRYSPATDSWVPTAVTAPGPASGRWHHRAVWTGSELIVWGGEDLSGALATGARYVPATDTWATMSAALAPTPRYGHSAVWTGAALVVWGGTDAVSNGFDTGGRYNPAADAWSATASAGAPSPRAAHTAVWTGSRMVVWGGSGATLVGNGGRYDPIANAWSSVAAAGAPSPRADHTAVWSGTAMIVWGGDTGAATGDGARYDPVADTWSPVSSSGAPSARTRHAAVWTGSAMIVWGGNDGSLPVGTGARYAPSSDSWSPMSTSGAPVARDGHSAVWTGLEMIVWGGESPALLDSGGRYEPVKDTWTSTNPLGAPHPRLGHSAAWTGGTMIVWGGLTVASGYADGGASYCACLSLYRDADGDGWGSASDTTSSCDGTIPAGYVVRPGDCNDANANVHPGALDNTCNGVDEDCNGTADDLWIGGLSQCGLGVCHSTGVFECISGQVVSTCTPGPPNASVDASCNALDDDCDGAVDDDYVPLPDSWTATAAGPTARTNHTAVWSGSEMIVFGGDNGSGTVRAGGEAYLPSGNTWRTLAAGPTRRWHHTAVWTGSRMVVWGGDDNVATVTNTGSRYDPATDTWVATTTAGAPTARGGHCAVWTGTRMVVWGGSDGVASLNTGSRYDPAGNAWSATAISGAPAARVFHTAVWTGTEMIVWGGQSAPGTGGALATGARYNPATNAWAAMATSGAPSARYGHVAVWTGTEMIVWGGTNGTSYLTNGARYDPAADVWAPISATGQPSRRAWASAVWTGTELIVWGGMYKTNETPDTPLADGARYNPATDTWTAMNTLSAPVARARAAAVWSGSELIVWGGDPVGAARSDGGRYSLQTVCGTGGCQRTGSTVCSGGVVSFQCVPAPPTPEVCDGLDNNCNVAVDEGIPAPNGRPTMFAAKLAAFGDVQLTWSATADTTGYDVTRGSLTVLQATGGDFTTAVEACVANNLAATAAEDAQVPAPGNGLWYLVRPVNACSGVGSYDDPPPQAGLRDAEINSSGAACP